jgi:SulP family sulfate permease
VLALALPALAGLLMVVGFQAIRPERLRLTWRTSWEARATMLFTLASTLILPLYLAVFVGVGLSALLHLYRSSVQGEVVELVRIRLGEWAERPPPSELRSHAVTVLDFHGNLFYASAWMLERKLPEVGMASAPVVVFRLHGQDEMSNTMIGVIERYHHRLRARGGRLLLAGMSDKAMRQLERTEVLKLLDREHVFPAGRYLHQAIEEAYQFGREWTERRKGG